jgi:hypothetical protein
MNVNVSPKVAGVVIAAALVGTWFGSTVSENVAREQAGRVPAGVRAVGTSTPLIVAPAERLRERVPQAPLPQRGRNPFVYGPRVPARTSSLGDRSSEPAVAAAAPLTVEAPAVPLFRLSGIASDAKDGEPVFTAILIDHGAMVFAKAGDKLSNGYSVVRVEEMSVTLADASGITQTIRLP